MSTHHRFQGAGRTVTDRGVTTYQPAGTSTWSYVVHPREWERHDGHRADGFRTQLQAMVAGAAAWCRLNGRPRITRRGFRIDPFDAGVLMGDRRSGDAWRARFDCPAHVVDHAREVGRRLYAHRQDVEQFACGYANAACGWGA